VDIVKRLRERKATYDWMGYVALLREAADEIELLRLKLAEANEFKGEGDDGTDEVGI